MELRIVSFALALFGLWIPATAQVAPYLKEVVILNGGMFGDPTQNVVVTTYNPFTGVYRQSDTIHTQSSQDLLLDGDVAYVAAQDSIVKIDLTDMSRLAANAFPGPSTYGLELHGNLLFVGNWYGQSDSNLYVFNANNLSLNKIIGNIFTGVKGMAIVGDTLYVSQNLTSSAWSDSAGYLAVVDLNTLSYVRDIPGDGVSDMGKLTVRNGQVWSLNSASNTYTVYNPATGGITQTAFANDVSGGYLSNTLINNDTLWATFDGALGAYDLANDALVIDSLIDTTIVGFVMDDVANLFYITATDYFSYTAGLIYDRTGTLQGGFDVGFAPEVIKPRWAVNTAPVAVNDQDTTTENTDVMLMVLANDNDVDNDSLILNIATPPTNGTAVVIANHILYTPTTGFIGADSVQYQICDVSAASLCANAWAKVWVDPPTGVSELGEDILINIYPNPVMDELNLTANTAAPLKVLITDVTGRIVTQSILQNQSKLDTRHWAKGMYVVELTGDGVLSRKQVIKQ